MSKMIIKVFVNDKEIELEKDLSEAIRIAKLVDKPIKLCQMDESFSIDVYPQSHINDIIQIYVMSRRNKHLNDELAQLEESNKILEGKKKSTGQPTSENLDEPDGEEGDEIRDTVSEVASYYMPNTTAPNSDRITLLKSLSSAFPEINKKLYLEDIVKRLDIFDANKTDSKDDLIDYIANLIHTINNTKQ